MVVEMAKWKADIEEARAQKEAIDRELHRMIVQINVRESRAISVSVRLNRQFSNVDRFYFWQRFATQKAKNRAFRRAGLGWFVL